MLDFTTTEIKEIIIHFVGNKGNEEACSFSKKTIKNLPEALKETLVNYLTASFKNSEFYEFWHHADTKQNDVFTFSANIFSVNESEFVINSKNIANTLYESSLHPNIKSGELCIVHFSKIMLDDKAVDAIGIFKSESKDIFLKFIKNENNNYEILEDSGISLSKLEKGCLIFNTSKKTGFKIVSIDNVNKINAQYWNDDFLRIRPCVDEFHQTRDFLNITKNYITKKLAEEFEVTKTDQIDLLNRSVEYFKNNEVFEKKAFEKKVLADPGIIKSFRSYDESYRTHNDIEVADEFEISPQAVKKQARIFKSVLKLDKNFHIYIHGDKELIEQGVDKDGRKYYKLYFEKEH